jgi:steroid delta-isomerase-like uncharacterized protein
MKKLLCIVPLILLFCFTIACQDKAAMAELEKYKAQAKLEEQNTALFHKVVEEWNKRNSEYFKDVYAPDYVYFSPSGTSKSMSREDVIEMMKMLWTAFPDCIWSINELVATGEMVMSRSTFKGTHKEAYQGIPPTGNKIELFLMNMSRIRNGKIIEEREELDGLSLMQQLGMELKPIAAKKK